MARLEALWVAAPLCIAAIATIGGSAAGGPIKTDGSLGRAEDVQPASSDVPEYRIRPELGKLKGRNLFHSFQRFGLPEDATAIFLPPDGSPSINHVMARVTGKQPSEILGTLRSEVPQADLWLINPNGVVIGKDAQIDVPSAAVMLVGHNDGPMVSRNPA